MDNADRAQKIRERDLKKALSEHANRVKDKAIIIDGASCCCDCEEPIEENRLIILPDVARCILCQTDYEKLKQRGLV